MTVRLAWSKNVYEESDCPKQMVLGSRNSKFCVLLNLSLFLEKWLQDGVGTTSQWLFANGSTEIEHVARKHRTKKQTAV